MQQPQSKQTAQSRQGGTCHTNVCQQFLEFQEVDVLQKRPILLAQTQRGGRNLAVGMQVTLSQEATSLGSWSRERLIFHARGICEKTRQNLKLWTTCTLVACCSIPMVKNTHTRTSKRMKITHHTWIAPSHTVPYHSVHENLKARECSN